MPSKNALKKYKENGFYHIYNRGIDKREIFLDKYDYAFFLKLLKDFLSDNNNTDSLEKGTVPFSKKNYFNEVTLLSFCLMPNHFHLLIKQKNLNSMSNFIKSLSNNYSNYFNKKYNRVGTLFQGRYKAVLVEKDEYLLHLSKYIHLNPLNIIEKGTVPFSDLVGYEYSSYMDYLSKRSLKWLNTKFILQIFCDSDLIEEELFSYKDFVEITKDESMLILDKLTIDT